MSNPELKPEELKKLLVNGYTDDVQAFTSIGFLFDAQDFRWEAKQTEAEESSLYRSTQSALRAADRAGLCAS